jgi:SAM-dependent methyltransferase
MSNHRPVKDHAFEPLPAEQAREMDDTLWWMVGRRSIIRNYLELAERRMPLELIIDVGCGSGGNLNLLSQYAAVVGVEKSPVLADVAKSRNVAAEIIAGDLLDLEPREPATMITLFDVLEHIEEDGVFVARLSHYGSPSHMVLISVPACELLYSRHDELLHHYRRYSRKGLIELLNRSGYRVIASSYSLFLLFPVVFLARTMERVSSAFGRKRMRPNVGEVPRWLNGLLIRIIKFEALLGRRVRFPVGVWLFALAIRDR